MKSKWLRVASIAVLLCCAGQLAFGLGTEEENPEGSAVISDPSTSLDWLRCPLGSTITKTGGCDGAPESMTWHKAVLKAKSFEIGGFKDWRLPSKEEFKTMWDFTRPVDLDFASRTVHPKAKNGSALSLWTEFESQFLSAGNSGYKHWMRDLSAPRARYDNEVLIGAYYMEFTNLTRKKKGLYREAIVSANRWDDVMQDEEIFERATNGKGPSTTKGMVVLVRGGSSSAASNFAEVVALAERNISAYDLIIQTRQAEEVRQRKIAEQNEMRQRAADDKEKIRFSSLVAGKDPQIMYRAAVAYEGNGEYDKAKSIYQAIMGKYARSNEARQAANRITRMSNAEATSRAAQENGRNTVESVIFSYFDLNKSGVGGPMNVHTVRCTNGQSSVITEMLNARSSPGMYAFFIAGRGFASLNEAANEYCN